MAKAFSKQFTLNTTFYHVKNSVDISIKKCVACIGKDNEKTDEVVDTIKVLNDLRAAIEAFEVDYKTQPEPHVEEVDEDETIS